MIEAKESVPVEAPRALTPREERLKHWMLVSAVIFVLGGLAVAAGPLLLTDWFLSESASFVTAAGSATNPLHVAVAVALSWNVLAVGAMASLAICAFRGWSDPRGGWALPIAIFELVSAGMAIVVALLRPGTFTHTVPLVAVVFLPLGLATLWSWALARRR